MRWPDPGPGQALQVEDMQAEFDAVERVQHALRADGVDDISFMVESGPDGKTVLNLFDAGPAVESGIGSPYMGALVLVEGAVPEPWRRLPEPVPGAVPAPSADLTLLERTLRERLPDAIGATEAEIAETEARLGVELPDEIKVLYRVTRARWQDWGDDYDYEAVDRVADAVGCELFSLDGVYVADASPGTVRGSSPRRRRSSPPRTPQCRGWSALPAGSSSATTAAAIGWPST